MQFFFNIVCIRDIKITGVRIVAKNEIYTVYTFLDYYYLYHVHKNLRVTY